METCTRCGLDFERADGPRAPEHNGIHGPARQTLRELLATDLGDGEFRAFWASELEDV